jgi:chromosome segregation ATPase
LGHHQSRKQIAVDNKEKKTMADLDPLREEVAGLNKIESNDFEFMDALDHIEAAGKTADEEIVTLRNILNSFRLKLPNRETLDVDRIRARDLANSLSRATLALRIARINARNDALARLTAELQTQIDKANSDANLLKRIKDAVDKATKTVNEAKALLDQLQKADASTKAKLKALIDSLGNVSTIFNPEA